LEASTDQSLKLLRLLKLREDLEEDLEKMLNDKICKNLENLTFDQACSWLD